MNLYLTARAHAHMFMVPSPFPSVVQFCLTCTLTLAVVDANPGSHGTMVFRFALQSWFVRELMVCVDAWRMLERKRDALLQRGGSFCSPGWLLIGKPWREPAEHPPHVKSFGWW